MDKTIDWKKTNSKSITICRSHTAEDWLCQPSRDEAGYAEEEELEKIIISDSDQIPPFFLKKREIPLLETISRDSLVQSSLSLSSSYANKLCNHG